MECVGKGRWHLRRLQAADRPRDLFEWAIVMKSRVLVTGGAGFIGSHIVEQLIAAGYRVRVVDKLIEQVHGTNGPRYVSEEAEFIQGDVADRDLMRRALKG